MKREELKKEFEKYLKDSTDYYDPREPLTERKLLQMWLDCGEPREKRIAELEAQIEKMKCCLFCAYRSIDLNFSSICIQKDNTKIENPYTCKCDKWEIKEK